MSEGRDSGRQLILLRRFVAMTIRDHAIVQLGDALAAGFLEEKGQNGMHATNESSAKKGQ